jgi:hypothetical protein
VRELSYCLDLELIYLEFLFDLGKLLPFEIFLKLRVFVGWSE